MKNLAGGAMDRRPPRLVPDSGVDSAHSSGGLNATHGTARALGRGPQAVLRVNGVPAL